MTISRNLIACDVEEIMSLAAELAGKDEEGGLNSDMLENEPFMLFHGFNHTERHYVKRALEQLQKKTK